ncbi:substrate-binding domain-containing protein [Nitrospira sp. M1]
MKKPQPNTRRTNTQDTSRPEGSIENGILAVRQAKGFSQIELARRVGLTRQAMHAIEQNHYLPNTSVALQLARILDCQVEDLFSLHQDEQEIEAEFLGTLPVEGQSLRVNISHVGNRILARPLSQLGDMLNYVVPADGIVTETIQQPRNRNTPRVRVSLLHDQERLTHNIVIAGCDPSLFLAGEHVRHETFSGVTNWTMGSVNAVNALLDGEVHMAGVHLVDARSGESNLPYLRQHVRGKDFLGVRFASWVQGFVVHPENPKHIRCVDDLAKRGIQLVNREAGSGARILLDSLLKKSGISGKHLTGYGREVSSHLEVARNIRDGLADIGIGVESAARQYGLAFIPLREEQYDLILRKDSLASHPTISRLFDAIVSRPFRQELLALGGYDLSEIGKSLNW